MRSFPTACLTRRVCGREVVPGAAVCQGSIPRVPGVHHRRGLPHANALPRRHHSQVRDMGHGRTGKKIVSKLENTSNLKPFLCGTWPTFLLFPSLFARIYSCWATPCENLAKESIRWKSFYLKEVRNHDDTVHSTRAFISEFQCYMNSAL